MRPPRKQSVRKQLVGWEVCEIQTVVGSTNPEQLALQACMCAVTGMCWDCWEPEFETRHRAALGFSPLPLETAEISTVVV